MLITISGLPGSGTSTVARAVAGELGLERLDGGAVFRALATERGLSLAAFSSLAEADDRIDRELDARLLARARRGDVVLESRLAGWLVTSAELPALTVWIHCDAPTRAERVAEREGTPVRRTAEENVAREASERARYRAYYGWDIDDRSIYDLVLDSTSEPAEALVSAILAAAAPQ